MKPQLLVFGIWAGLGLIAINLPSVAVLVIGGYLIHKRGLLKNAARSDTESDER